MNETEKISEVYANALTITNTFFDFSLKFMKENIIEQNGEQKKELNDVALVRMSPQMAKALYTLLQNNVQKYEKTYGEIPVYVK